MKLRLFSLFLALALLFSLVGCTAQPLPTETSATTLPPTTEAPAEASDTPLYWQVSGNGYEGAFYLLGSIHVSDGIAYPDSLLDAFARCDTLAVESDVLALEQNMTAMMEMMQQMLYTDGSTISDHLDTQTYESARQLLRQLGIYDASYDYYIPIFWSQLISSALLERTCYSSSNGVDRYFLTLAKTQEKQIVEVEGYLDVYTALSDLSEQTQIYMLEQAVADAQIEDYESSVTSLLEAWRHGDEQELLSLLFIDAEDGYSDQEESCLGEYNRALVSKRNSNMAQKALAYLSEGKNVFFVVGLAHMLGSGGIIDLLREQGYSVTAVEY